MLHKNWIVLRTFLIAATSGFVLHSIGIFLPWLLGPMISLLLLRQYTKLEFHWPKILRQMGLIFLGIQIGSSFTKKAIELMWVDLPLMALLTFSVVTVALLLSYVFMKMSGETVATSVLGSLPGGLSQMVLLSEEVKSANSTVVMLMQTFRIFVVVTIVPFLTAWIPKGSHFNDGSLDVLSSFNMTHFIIVVVVGIALFIGMKKNHFPLPELMAPIIAMAIVQFITDHPVVEVPLLVLILSQIFVGSHLGLQLEKVRDKLSVRMFSAIVLSNLVLIAFCVGFAYVLTAIHPINTFLDFFISAAPGGIAEMSITALETGADLSTVTSFHLFRIFFILLIAGPILTYALKKWLK
ncbi:AbrB family transcriptional regulator [Paenisporosarcina sp. TG-14]|uniref:AbrB family transcriptional regulator n=1 Tax=Paenisporosarcina sp. TG-14 TaxID=1231057 RepID=UPI0002DA7729|nr:AbrB family transcriptional regulator [Paenisporosarcina sp. TG-14]